MNKVEPVAWIVRHPRFCGKFTDDKEIAEYWERKKQGCTTPLFAESSMQRHKRDSYSRLEELHMSLFGPRK